MDFGSFRRDNHIAQPATASRRNPPWQRTDEVKPYLHPFSSDLESATPTKPLSLQRPSYIDDRPFITHAKTCHQTATRRNPQLQDNTISTTQAAVYNPAFENTAKFVRPQDMPFPHDRQRPTFRINQIKPAKVLNGIKPIFPLPRSLRKEISKLRFPIHLAECTFGLRQTETALDFIIIRTRSPAHVHPLLSTISHFEPPEFATKNNSIENSKGQI
jgi:hypothetical protein